MRPSLVRAFAAYPRSLAQQRPLRGRVSAPPHSAFPMPAISGGWRRPASISGTAGRGAEEGDLSDDIADLNAEIGGFVGDLGDPDFDSTAPSGPRSDGQDASPANLRGSMTLPGGPPAEPQAPQSIGSKQQRARLTQADHPLAAERIPGHDAELEQSDRSASLVAGRRHVENQARRVRSVLVLNGAACFVDGKLATTGEPQGAITKSMEAVAGELNLSLTICTSNREDELLDKLCEGGYDAIVYNPSGFQDAGFQDIRQAAADPDAVVQADGGESGESRRQQLLLRDERKKRGGLGNGRAIEYGLTRARCPVVLISPRDGAAAENRVPPSQLGRGAISGFSGVVSYRLAMVAVASVLDDHR